MAAVEETKRGSKGAWAGVVVILQPGGSMRDDEVIAACDKRGVPMVMTGARHFRH